MFKRFQDRREAGIELAKMLGEYANRPDVIVLALPRGGVPVAFEVAKSLNAPLDVFIVRKLGMPGQEEFAFGAIASGGVSVINEEILPSLNISQSEIERVILAEKAEVLRREKLYRGGKPELSLCAKTVIVVDDGLATGHTMRAAVEALEKYKPAKIVVAAPVASVETCREFSRMTDAVCICSMKPEPFYAVGLWYRDFSQTSDGEVIDLLNLADKKISGDLAA